jgi:NAD kinase
MMNRAGRGLQDTLEHLASGRFFTTGFPLLNIHGVDLEGIAREGFGLNDVYIQRMTSQSCKLKVTLWGEPLGFSPLLCDGVIVSTPLGSTAYSYNVTGSMVSINTPALTFTPIAANRTCPARNIILPLDTPFGFEILEPSKRRAQIVCDAFSLGDLVEAKVEISPREVQLAFCRSEEQRLPMRFINKMVGQP